MKLISRLSFISLILVLTACSSSNDVVSGKLIQKRKYLKGYHLKSAFDKPQDKTAKVQKEQKRNEIEYVRPAITESIKDSSIDFRTFTEKVAKSINMSNEEYKKAQSTILFTSVEKLSKKHLENNLKRLQHDRRVQEFHRKLLDRSNDEEKGPRWGMIGFFLYLGGGILAAIGVIILFLGFFTAATGGTEAVGLILASLALIILGGLASLAGIIMAIVSIVQNANKENRTKREKVDLVLAIIVVGLVALSLLAQLGGGLFGGI